MFEDEFYEIVDIVYPSNARQLNPPTLRELFLRFPNLKMWCDRNKAECEWRSQSLLPIEEIGCATEDSILNMDDIEFWVKILQMKVNKEPRFPNLNIVISFLLSMP